MRVGSGICYLDLFSVSVPVHFFRVAPSSSEQYQKEPNRGHSKGPAVLGGTIHNIELAIMFDTQKVLLGRASSSV